MNFEIHNCFLIPSGQQPFVSANAFVFNLEAVIYQVFENYSNKIRNPDKMRLAR